MFDVIYKVLLEAQELAVRDHNVEFKSNLWIGVLLCQACFTLWINITVFCEFIDC